MENVIKITLGSLGSLGGGGTLSNVNLHDSTCSCEGCQEKQLAEREFSINTSKVFGAKDYGFNEGDEEDLFNKAGEVIVLSDDDGNDADNDDTRSISDIFDIYDDEPSDDAGYCDDGQDSEDAYSVCSPKPCSAIVNDANGNEEGKSDDDIEEEDTPPAKDATFEDVISNTSIEASKRDGKFIEDCAHTIEQSEHSTIRMKELDKFMDQQRFSAAKYWKHQIHVYEAHYLKLSLHTKTLSKRQNDAWIMTSTKSTVYENYA